MGTVEQQVIQKKLEEALCPAGKECIPHVINFCANNSDMGIGRESSDMCTLRVSTYFCDGLNGLPSLKRTWRSLSRVASSSIPQQGQGHIADNGKAPSSKQDDHPNHGQDMSVFPMKTFLSVIIPVSMKTFKDDLSPGDTDPVLSFTSPFYHHLGGHSTHTRDAA
jgi:hypothetical protein